MRRKTISQPMKLFLLVIFIISIVFVLIRTLTFTCSYYNKLSKSEVSQRVQMLKWKLDLDRTQLLRKKNCMIFKKNKLTPISLNHLFEYGLIQLYPNKIPMILHTTWKHQKLPPEWQVVAHICRKANQNFTFCHWDDEELEIFVATFYPELLFRYLSYSYLIQRSDAARYMLLHHFGGIYKDTNIGCRVPFDFILHHNQQLHKDTHSIPFKVLLYSQSSNIVAADFLASTPQHPFFTHLLNLLKKTPWQMGLPYLDVMRGTGPMFLAQSFSSFYTQSDLQHKREIAFIPTSMFEKVYFYFLPGGTWHCVDGAVIWWVSEHWAITLFSVFFLMLSAFILMRNKLFMQKKVFF